MNDKTDKELLNMILSTVTETKNRVSNIEKTVNVLDDKQREIYTTVYGDEKKNIKGLSRNVGEIKESMDKYKKLEYTAMAFIGFLTFLGGLVLGIHQLMK